MLTNWEMFLSILIQDMTLSLLMQTTPITFLLHYTPQIKIINQVFLSYPNPSIITDLFSHFSYIFSMFRACTNSECLLVKLKEATAQV